MAQKLIPQKSKAFCKSYKHIKICQYITTFAIVLSESIIVETKYQNANAEINAATFAIRPLYSLHFKSLEIQNNCHVLKIKWSIAVCINRIECWYS
jgi:hypothetical protein